MRCISLLVPLASMMLSFPVSAYVVEDFIIFISPVQLFMSNHTVKQEGSQGKSLK